ncbi:MAG: tyrosine-type recombinase/integrase [Neobacillus sp.]
MALFNDKYIDGLKPKIQEYYETEDKAERKGGRFAVRVFPSGQKHFYFIYYFESKKRRYAIGTYGKKIHGKMSLEEARKIYADYSRLLDSGIDPKAEKERIEREKADQIRIEQQLILKTQQQGSIKQLLDLYLEHLYANKSFNYARDSDTALKANVYSVWDLSTKADQITKTNVVDVLYRISERGADVLANRVRAYLSSAFKFGIEFDDSVLALKHGIKFHIPFNPVTAVPKVLKNEPVGERVLTEAEVLSFWQLLDNSAMHVSRKQVFKLMLATGQRVEEVAAMTWGELNLSEQIWSLPSPRTKNRLSHIVPLNNVGLAILQEARALNLHSQFVFPAKCNTRPFPTDGFSQALSRLLKKSTIEKFDPRDLRRTFKTLAAKAGLSKEIRDRLQNHAMNDVSSKHYDKYDYLQEKTQAMQIWGDYLAKILDN